MCEETISPNNASVLQLYMTVPCLFVCLFILIVCLQLRPTLIVVFLCSTCFVSLSVNKHDDDDDNDDDNV